MNKEKTKPEPPDQGGRFRRRCVVTSVYTLLIFAFLPVFPTLWNTLSLFFPGLLKGVVYALVPLLVILFFIFFLFVKKNRDPIFYVWSAVFLFSYGPLVYYYCEYPAERFHLAEYGLLVILTHWCLKVRLKSSWIFFIVILYALLIGLIDEIIQGILPNRVYEFKDVTINWASSFLALGLLAGATWPRDFKGKNLLGFRKWAALVVPLMILGNGTFLYHKYWRPPLNVILLTVDTLRPDHLGSYGYDRNTTPFLDSVARQGVLFKNVISSAPWTTPGMISIFTGLYPTLHGVQARGQSLLPDTPTLFKVFKDHGYQVPNISYLTEIPNFSNLGLGPKEPGSLKEASRPGQELLRWLDDHHRDRFILWYHYRFIHLPYNPPEPYNIFLSKNMKDHLESRAIDSVLTESVIPHRSIPFTPEEQETVAALYDGQLRELDRFIETLYKRLTRWKLHRNTLLVLTADHGEELFEHGFLGHASTAIHATLYDEVLKIPLIFYAPSRFKKGRRLDKQVRQVDIMPTILDMAGLPRPERINGVSLLPRMRGKGDEKSLPAISESIMGGYQSSPEQEKIMLRSMRNDRWKLICTEEDGKEVCRLFELSRDPGEKRNLFEIKGEISGPLRKKLRAHFAGMQTRRLTMLAKQKPRFTRDDIPRDAKLEKPVLLFPRSGSTIHLAEQGGRMALQWTGEKDLSYVIEYDVGRGWRNLKGAIPVQGTAKVFGPLPREAWEPLPYWNPYRIRVAPYGLEEYWSEWVEFTITE